MFNLLKEKKGFRQRGLPSTTFSLLKTKSSAGFTLIEMLIVIGIIGMLSSFTAYSFTRSRPKARLAAVQTQMNNLHPYLVICANNGTTVDFVSSAPAVGGKICSTANAVAKFELLPANWSYTTSPLDSYKAYTCESDTWEVVCTETGCVTNTPIPVLCP